MRTRLLIAFLVVIIAALGTVLLISNYSTNVQVRGYVRRSMNESSTMFAEELNTYFHEKGTWAGVEMMFMETGAENTMMEDNSNQMGNQHQGQGANRRKARAQTRRKVRGQKVLLYLFAETGSSQTRMGK